MCALNIGDRPTPDHGSQRCRWDRIASSWYNLNWPVQEHRFANEHLARRGTVVHNRSNERGRVGGATGLDHGLCRRSGVRLGTFISRFDVGAGRRVSRTAEHRCARGRTAASGSDNHDHFPTNKLGACEAGRGSTLLDTGYRHYRGKRHEQRYRIDASFCTKTDRTLGPSRPRRSPVATRCNIVLSPSSKCPVNYEVIAAEWIMSVRARGLHRPARWALLHHKRREQTLRRLTALPVGPRLTAPWLGHEQLLVAAVKSTR
jgi:hypothetical protein